MAELCARQGRFGDALSIYRRLLSGSVAADKRARWEARMGELGRAPLVAAAARPVAGALVTAPSPVVRAVAARLPVASPPRPAVVAPPPAPELKLPLLVTQPVRSGQV